MDVFNSKDNINKTSEIDINEKIAASCLKSLAYSSRLENINSSVAGFACNQNNKIRFTEFYFYEESAFYFMTALEAQQSYGIINTFISIVSQDIEFKKRINMDEILKYIHKICIDVAFERITISGLKRSFQDHHISDFIDRRYQEYIDSYTANLASTEPVQKENWMIGLSPRNHPLKIYLGKISDNMSKALDITEHDKLSQTLVETSLLGVYTSILSSVASISENNLTIAST